ncbi:S-adenosyl-L-methionine-dependent methyltransferase [Lasiosphaeria hispida]|uniref:Leucine carboxyl methyltransferase 1 n=1 Tax=Lasiosphaeria hispida TaxID=260671 RepID=A0AAJ0HIY4_9PEZI|nr:S-adenosyl-L-methionine-dependent methyltransferase [Lasiosphaeria hispida]
MSAPIIPNLLSLRGSSRGRGRGFGRGRGGSSASALSASAPGHDATIQATDTDAAVSRLSAVEIGYLQDPFAGLFVQPAPPGPTSRRLPIINRGTYTRTTAVDAIVNHFLASTTNQRRQIVSLGAGTDTRALRLFSSNTHTNIAYHEIDFPTITQRKLHSVRTSPHLRTVLTVTTPPLTPPPSSWTATGSPASSNNTLHCHGIDLRLLPSTDTLPSLDPSLPTLLISECCLCYLAPAAASAVVAYFTLRLPRLGLVLYEPVKPDDPFGRMMVSNLAARRIEMPTLDVFPLPVDQERRLQQAGFDAARHMTIDKVWEKWVTPDEKERVDGLEGLDEVEEWLLLAGHYIVAWGWRGDGFDLPDT